MIRLVMVPNTAGQPILSEDVITLYCIQPLIAFPLYMVIRNSDGISHSTVSLSLK